VVKTKSHRQVSDEFAAEVEIFASMDHPNIVRVIEYDLEAQFNLNRLQSILESGFEAMSGDFQK
jgi:hypothetical protein